MIETTASHPHGTPTAVRSSAKFEKRLKHDLAPANLAVGEAITLKWNGTTVIGKERLPIIDTGGRPNRRLHDFPTRYRTYIKPNADIVDEKGQSVPQGTKATQP
jgi:hypothetical protein